MARPSQPRSARTANGGQAIALCGCLRVQLAIGGGNRLRFRDDSGRGAAAGTARKVYGYSGTNDPTVGEAAVHNRERFGAGLSDELLRRDGDAGAGLRVDRVDLSVLQRDARVVGSIPDG